MKVYVRKVSNDDWFTIKEFKSFQDFTNYSRRCKHGLILNKNFWYKMPIKDIKYAFGVGADKAEEISRLEWEVTIYDSYIE